MGKRSRARAQARQHRAAAASAVRQQAESTTSHDPTVEVRGHVEVAVLALAAEHLTAYDDHLVVLAARCDEPGPRALVVSTLQQALDERLAQVWEGGWQPADLHRIALRRSTTAVAGFVVGVMGHDLARHARDTVHPTWWAQLDELDGGRAPAGAPVPAARAEGMSWLTVVDTTLRTLQLLSALPRVERITARPGTWVRPLTSAAADVDERILTRVRMLLAKAESTPYEAEAETFTAGAAALIARHRIDEALLAADQGPEGLGKGADARRIGIDNPYEHPKAQLLDAVARANSCRVVWSKELGFATVIGFPSDLEGVDLLFTSLLVQATRAMTATGQRATQGAHRRTRTFRSAFLTSFALRIGERLSQAAAAEEHRVGSERGDSTRSRLPVLVEREQRVEEAVTAFFPQVRQTRSRATFDAEGWHHGRRAADDAQMHVRPAVGEATG